jgi:Avidin family
MTWKGKWRNQYGSIVDITDDANRRISGTFKTALKDSGFYGQEIPVVGIHQGNCISFVAGGETAAEDAAVSYTGLLRDGKMETMWFVVADSVVSVTAEGAAGRREKLSWWRSISTNADTFERL